MDFFGRCLAFFPVVLLLNSALSWGEDYQDLVQEKGLTEFSEAGEGSDPLDQSEKLNEEFQALEQSFKELDVHLPAETVNTPAQAPVFPSPSSFSDTNEESESIESVNDIGA